MLVLARLLSLIGHPALLMPVAVVLAVQQRQAPPAVLRLALGLTLAVAAAVIAYSLWQVRRGRWRHVDASVPAERRELNGFVAGVLLAAAAVAAAGSQRSVALGLAAGAALVLLALLLRRRIKLSLHAAFGALAVTLAWPHAPAMAVLALLVAGVSWSRLALARHSTIDVAAGLLAGAAAGLGFHALV